MYTGGILLRIGADLLRLCMGIGKLLLYAAVERFLRFGSLCADLSLNGLEQLLIISLDLLGGIEFT